MHVNAGERRGPDEDRQLLADEKMKKAQQMLNDNAYQDKKQEILSRKRKRKKWMSFLLRAPCVRKELPVAGPLHVKRRITERS